MAYFISKLKLRSRVNMRLNLQDSRSKRFVFGVSGDDGQLKPDGVRDGDNDFDGDGIFNKHELQAGTNPVEGYFEKHGFRLTVSRGEALNTPTACTGMCRAGGVIKWSLPPTLDSGRQSPAVILRQAWT